MSKPEIQQIISATTQGISCSSGSCKRVLVIGTTTDYIDFICRHCPGRAVFVTDPAVRDCGEEPPPDQDSEILVPLDKSETVMERIRCHLQRYGIRASGVACFDCESICLALLVAKDLGLPYLSKDAAVASRSKFLSKKLWQQAGLDCPAAAQVGSSEDVAGFFRQHGGGRIILKPLTGSGSELLFVCSSADAAAEAFSNMTSHMAEMTELRMYAPYEAGGALIDPRTVFVAEEYCDGIEYSCDFFIEGNLVEIIRVTRKWMKDDPAPGTALAYQVVTDPPIDNGRLRDVLKRGTAALGIERGICMVDFLVSADRLILLELTPRPGGDCIPQLLRASCGLDILALALDVAESRSFKLPEPGSFHPLVGLRLFAPPPGGVISLLDAGAIMDDPRILEVKLTRKAGDKVVHPPDDYESRILGYAILRPYSDDTVGQECKELLDRLVVNYSREGMQ